MKTRTNQPIELANTQDIEHLNDSFLNELKAGDIITKQTGNQKHTYVVSYKEEKHGICLTYVDCGYMETISYDYTNGHWVFNSKDVLEPQEKLVSGTNIKTIGGQSILGSGNLAISGGTQLYQHYIHNWTGTMISENNPIYIISTSNQPFTMDSLALISEGSTPNVEIISIFEVYQNRKAIALKVGGYLPGAFTRLTLYYQYVDNGEVKVGSDTIAEDALGSVNGFTDTITTL